MNLEKVKKAAKKLAKKIDKDVEEYKKNAPKRRAAKIKKLKDEIEIQKLKKKLEETRPKTPTFSLEKGWK